jgi:WD40 repeat protein
VNMADGDEEEEVSKYLLVKLENVSPKPIQSLGTYVSLDAECVVAGSSDRNLRFLDTDSLDEIARCTVNKKSVNCVAISEMSLDGDDPIIVTGGKDSFIQIWNPTAGSLEKNIELPTNEVRSLAIYQGSETYLLVGTKDAKVILWDVLKNKLVRIFEGHRASIHSVSISSSVLDIEKENDLDFLCIASGGADRTVRTWDLNTGRKKKKFRYVSCHHDRIGTLSMRSCCSECFLCVYRLC